MSISPWLPPPHIPSIYHRYPSNTRSKSNLSSPNPHFRRSSRRRLSFVPPPDPTFADDNDRSERLLRTTDEKIALNRPDGDLHRKDLANARESAFSKPGLTVFTCNSVLKSMRSAKRYEDTVSLFNYFFTQSDMIIPNCTSYDILISTYCDMGNADIALDVFRHVMHKTPLRPLACSYCYLTKGLVGAGLIHEAIDLRREYKGTYECITKVLVDAGRIDEAMDVLSEMLKEDKNLRKEMQSYGDRPDPLVSNCLVYGNLILGFLNLGNLEKAKELFNELKERNPKQGDFDSTDVVTAMFMNWFVEQGREKGAMESYKFLLDKPDTNAYLIEKQDMNASLIETDTFNEILEVFIKHGRKAEAGALFAHLLYDHRRSKVNSNTFNILIEQCFREGRVSEAYDLYKRSSFLRLIYKDLKTSNNMIKRYCENEMMDEAEKIFLELCEKSTYPDPNDTSYSTLINAYFKAGRVDDALEKFVKMVEANLTVCIVTANRWLSKLIEKGKVVDCVTILRKMGVRSSKRHVTSFDTVVRALCKERNLDASLDLVEQMLRYGVGVTPELKKYLSMVFRKKGRAAEIKYLFIHRKKMKQGKKELDDGIGLAA